jgi:fermentation-respiration switch protein FrsA (DUF1100 family)
MRKEIVAIVGLILAAYPIVVVSAYYSQSYVIFQSRGASLPPPPGLAVDVVALTTPDGERLHAWWLQTAGARKTVLYFQANGTDISQKPFRLATFRKMGVNALLIDYRGYGRSTGRITQEADIYTDGMAAWNYLVHEKGIAPNTIIIWGRSLGGAVAAEIAQHNTIAALILESTFYSLDDIARRRYWFLPTTRLLRFHFENGRKLKQVAAPVIIIHSVKDDYIPFEHARNLFAAASHPKLILKTTGSHLDSFDLRWSIFASSSDGNDSRERVVSALTAYVNR